ncbi:MAG: hypothetical protein ACI4LM_06575 [Anaerovoracaceae bacterium]|jgi:hypothetical protein
MSEVKFADEFLKIYDRMIAAGEITFFSSGIKKDEFTNMCMNSDYILEEERLDEVAVKMGLSADETAMLRELAGYGR